MVTTPSSGPTPRAHKDRCSAAVQELTATAYLAPKYSAALISNFSVLGPVVSQPEVRVSTTSRISASPTRGGEKGRNSASGSGRS